MTETNFLGKLLQGGFKAELEKARIDERARILRILKKHRSHRRGSMGELALRVAISEIESTP